jgi:hypothetical protein
MLRPWNRPRKPAHQQIVAGISQPVTVLTDVSITETVNA